MSKELPYFKFDPNAWDNGMIQLCSYNAKGLFIEICSMYWSRLGSLPYALALQKLCNGNADMMQELVDNEIFELDGKDIRIEFLDEQLAECLQVSQKRSLAAKKRWDNASGMQVHSKSNAIKKRKEKKREEKKAFVAPTIDEVVAYFKENGYTEASGRRAWEYYEAGNWKDGRGNQVKAWKQKMRGVWFKDENLMQKPEEVDPWLERLKKQKAQQ